MENKLEIVQGILEIYEKFPIKFQFHDLFVVNVIKIV